MSDASTPPKKAPVVLPLWQQIPLSAVAGSLAWFPTHPWELAKNRVILNHYASTGAAFSAMAKEGSFFDGFSAGISRQVVYTAFRLGLYEPMRGVSASMRGGDPGSVTPFDRIVAGASAGMCASFLSSPVEVCLVMQSNVAKDAPKLSLPQTFSKVLAERGVGGFWSGCVPLMTRAAIVGVSQVSFNDQCKSYLVANHNAGTWEPRNLTAVSGVITGIFYAFVTMPIEVVRVRMSSSKVKTGIATAITDFIKHNGVGAVYQPFVPYCGRCVIHTAVTFMVLDALKRQLIALQQH